MSRLKKLLRKLPLLGGLADCRWKDHTEASKEFALNFVFSTAPIWLGGLIIFSLDKKDNKSFITSIAITMDSGELFMYAAAMVAPIIYMALKPEKGSRNFPGQLSHISLIAIIAIISAAFFALHRARVLVDENFVFSLSIALYIISLVLLYLATVYRNNRLEGAPDIVREQTAEFVEEFNRRHAP